MVAIAFANATIRELALMKQFNEFRSHQLSTITLIILCWIYTWFIFPYLQIQNAKQAFLTGLVWVLLTIAFELLLGVLTGKSWEFLLRDYDIARGRIWVLFLVSLLITPFVIYIVRKGF
jgi:flagellar biosynthesis protein FliR